MFKSISAIVMMLTVGIAASAAAASGTEIGGKTPPPNIEQTHILTGEGIGNPADGESKIPWTTLAPWLSVDGPTQTIDAVAAAAAGIAIHYYTDTAIQAVGDPFWTNDETEFAHDCSSRRITGTYAGRTIYLMDPSSANLLAAWVAHVENVKNNWGFPITRVLADSADNFGKFKARPCNNSQRNGFDQTAWNNALIAQYNSFYAQTGLKIVYNGLFTIYPNDGHTLSPGLALNASVGVFGGVTEECYANTHPVQAGPGGTTWEAAENTEIAQMLAHKAWFCSVDGEQTVDASQAIPERIYQLASFLLTYKPDLAYIKQGWATASNFRQNPETHLIALRASDPEPTDISQLQVNGTYYARMYNACYMAGILVGPCKVVVNASNSNYPLNRTGWNHTLALSGSDQFDGGVISTNGPQAPATIAARTAYILFN